MRMLVGRGRALGCFFAVIVCSGRIFFGLCIFTMRMKMSRLQVVMCGRSMVRGCLLMVVDGGMRCFGSHLISFSDAKN